MATYYYAAASLPMLTGPRQKAPLTSEMMLDVCQRFLTEKDYSSLVNSTLDPVVEEAPGICVSYRKWERSLRNDLARQRSAAQNLSPDEYIRDTELDPDTLPVAQKAMSETSPLEAEFFLDSCRWNKIEELSQGHFFDMEFLRAYRMKLLILERHGMFDEEQGFAAYRDLYARVLAASGIDIPCGGDKR